MPALSPVLREVPEALWVWVGPWVGPWVPDPCRPFRAQGRKTRTGGAGTRPTSAACSRASPAPWAPRRCARGIRCPTATSSGRSSTRGAGRRAPGRPPASHPPCRSPTRSLTHFPSALRNCACPADDALLSAVFLVPSSLLPPSATGRVRAPAVGSRARRRVALPARRRARAAPRLQRAARTRLRRGASERRSVASRAVSSFRRLIHLLSVVRCALCRATRASSCSSRLPPGRS